MSENKIDNASVVLDTKHRFSVRQLTPENARFTATEGGFASLELEGEKYDRVMFFRAFPFTAPDSYISVRETDTKKREIGMIQRLSDFDVATVELIEAQLRLRYFTPKILKVYSAKDKQGFSTLSVLTDRGKCKFTFRGGSDAVTRLSETRLIFTDIDGNRFEVPDLLKFSRNEQKKLDLYL